MDSNENTTLTEEEFQALTWNRWDWDRAVIDPESLERQCPLDNGRLQRSTVGDEHASAIGDLECLPLEIIHIILGILDLQTLTNFRAVSWHARSVVDSLPPYRAIVNNAPNALRALISTHTAVYSTANDIFRALCTRRCFKCKQFAPFLDLFTGGRYCFPCIKSSEDLCTLTAYLAKKLLGLSAKTMRSLPTLINLPGLYSIDKKRRVGRHVLVRMISALAVYKVRATGTPASNEIVTTTNRARSSAAEHLLLIDRSTMDSYKRHATMLRMPVLNRSSRLLDWGRCCLACHHGPRIESRGYQDWQRSYGFEEYAEHFKTCQLSQIGRKQMKSDDPIWEAQPRSSRIKRFFRDFKY